MGSGQAVVIAVHLAGQVEQGLAGMAGRPARDRAGGSRPSPTGCRSGCRRATGRSDQADAAPRRPGRPAPSRAGASRPAACRAGRAAGSGRREPAERPAARTRSVRPTRTGRRRPATRTPRAIASSSGVAESDPMAITRRDGRSPARRRRRGRPAPPGRSTANRISSSVQAIGWRTATTTASRVRATMMNRKVRLPNPDRRRRRRRHADRHVAEDAGDADQPEDRQHAPERAAHQDEQQQRPDRVGGDPFAGQGEAEQHADHRHRQPERGPALPPARPDGREDGIRRDDEQADVDVVHADPRLDEEHPVGDHEQRRRGRPRGGAGTGSGSAGRGGPPSGRRR